ncbi:sphingoid long chain base kinase [Pyronema omphalodes]|nr:sphingoid long chain base kinase [Pyronema omphalodes]KAI5817983.1 sphingoid long chain base kinase [Pyronema omphalodes]
MTMQEPLLRPAADRDIPGPSSSASASASASASSSSTRLGENTISLTKHLSLWYNETTFEIRDSKEPTDDTNNFCCDIGFNTRAPTKTLSIPLYNLLWIDVGASSITIKYAAPTKTSIKPASLTYPYSGAQHEGSITTWVTSVLDRSYGLAQKQKRCKVLINPFGGQGYAQQIFDKKARPILEAANCVLDIETTRYQGHAVDIAQNLDVEAFDVVICVSGDGVPSEVFNGFGKRKYDALKALRSVAVCQLPGGSGNAMCWNLTGTDDAGKATLAVVKGVRKRMDLISITQGKERLLSFLSQSFGIIAECDLGTEDLRWMGGARFTVGLLQRVIKQTVYPCDLAVKVAIEGKEEIRNHFRSAQGNDIQQDDDDDEEDQYIGDGLPPLKFGTVADDLPDGWELIHHPNMGNFYAGNMTWMSSGAAFFPASLPNDGLFDLVCIDGTISRRKAISMLLSVEDGSHFDLPHVQYRKVVAYRIIPHKRKGVKEEFISIDGERIDFEPFQAEVHKGLGLVIAKGDRYEAPGV